MNLQDYLNKKHTIKSEEPKFRVICETCTQPAFSCYCSHIHPFDSKIQFVILIHPIEMKRRIATGRMSHLCLKNSHLIMGHDYSDDARVNALLQNINNQCVLLYPGAGSFDVSKISEEQRTELFDKSKKLTVFVVDGTWTTARKMVRSKNLYHLPRICFTPTKQSNFRVRKQPMSHCLSTIEAIHQTIELVGSAVDFNTDSREHDKLLNVFDAMVEKQLEFVNKSVQENGGLSRRGLRERVA